MTQHARMIQNGQNRQIFYSPTVEFDVTLYRYYVNNYTQTMYRRIFCHDGTIFTLTRG